MKQRKILVNGLPAEPVSVLDRGFQYGDGVFTTIAVEKANPLLLIEHLQRLERDCKRLNIRFSEKLIGAEASDLYHDIRRAVLKIMVTRGVSGRGYRYDADAEESRIITLHDWPDYPADYTDRGIEARLCKKVFLPDNEILGGVKHMNCLLHILARKECEGDEAEVIISDGNNRVVEGSASNVFCIIDGELVTPDVSRGGVEGVMRQQVIKYSENLGMRCRIGDVTVSDLCRAEEVFLTNCVIGVWPVRRLDQFEYSKNAFAKAMLKTLREHNACI